LPGGKLKKGSAGKFGTGKEPGNMIMNACLHKKDVLCGFLSGCFAAFSGSNIKGKA